MVQTHLLRAPIFCATAKKVIVEFKRGSDSTEDDHRSGRLKILNADEQVDAIQPYGFG